MKLRSWLEGLLLLGGLVALNVWVWAIAVTSIFQSWQNWEFNREISGNQLSMTEFLSEKTSQLSGDFLAWWGFLREPQGRAVTRRRAAPQPPSIRQDGLVGRLTIPRLGLTAIVREGAGETTLRVALGHIPSTAFPGQPGNVGVAGHRDTLFRGLRDIRKSDLIEFETLSGRYSYQVDSTKIVKPTDVSVLNASENPQLTLVTCYPFYFVGSAPDRFIVKARLVGGPDAPNSKGLVAVNRS